MSRVPSRELFLAAGREHTQGWKRPGLSGAAGHWCINRQSLESIADRELESGGTLRFGRPRLPALAAGPASIGIDCRP